MFIPEYILIIHYAKVYSGYRAVCDNSWRTYFLFFFYIILHDIMHKQLITKYGYAILIMKTLRLYHNS